MWAWPGKKTLFMGCEFGQSSEWKYDDSLDWNLLEYKEHSGICDLLSDIKSGTPHHSGYKKTLKLFSKMNSICDAQSTVGEKEQNSDI